MLPTDLNPVTNNPERMLFSKKTSTRFCQTHLFIVSIKSTSVCPLCGCLSPDRDDSLVCCFVRAREAFQEKFVRLFVECLRRSEGGGGTFIHVRTTFIKNGDERKTVIP